MFESCEPNPCDQPVGACCILDGSCTVVVEAECAGEWLGAGSDCDPNPCPQPTGSCCYLDGTCEVTLEADCTGQWTMFGVCDPNPCPQPEEGACCFIDGTCQVLTELRCTEAEGSWQGPGTGCDPNPCPPPVPVEKTSWGQIKSNYR